jgi:hypothetical protein
MKIFAGSLALALTMILAPALAQEGTVESVHLDAHARLSGTTCNPTHVSFSGRIKTDGPAIVTYRWLRSDGTHKDAVLQDPPQSGKTVSMSWDQTSTTSGWVRLIVLAPKHIETPKTYFRVHCGTS